MSNPYQPYQRIIVDDSREEEVVNPLWSAYEEGYLAGFIDGQMKAAQETKKIGDMKEGKE